MKKCGYTEWKPEKKCCMKPKMPYPCKTSCCPPQPMKPTKECVKTVSCTYKIYRMCCYRVCVVCPCCGHEYDVHRHKGMCPSCHKMHHHGDVNWPDMNYDMDTMMDDMDTMMDD